MSMKEDLEEWQTETLDEAKLKAMDLEDEALKQTTYQDALDFLNKSKPKRHDCDYGNWPIARKFYEITDLIFDEVKEEIIKQAFSREIEHD